MSPDWARKRPAGLIPCWCHMVQGDWGSLQRPPLPRTAGICQWKQGMMGHCRSRQGTPSREMLEPRSQTGPARAVCEVMPVKTWTQPLLLPKAFWNSVCASRTAGTPGRTCAHKNCGGSPSTRLSLNSFHEHLRTSLLSFQLRSVRLTRHIRPLTDPLDENKPERP